MRLIELHILQSFPVTCLNRDDLGAPKSAVFGGVTRARISSQSLKRAIRMQAKELCPDLFQGERSRLIVEQIKDAAVAAGAAAHEALETAKLLSNYLASLDKDAEKKRGIVRVKTLMFLSPAALSETGKAIAAALKAGELEEALRAAKTKSKSSEAADMDGTDDAEQSKNRKKKKPDQTIRKIAKSLAKLQDAADIALFGRMVAADDSLTVEGSAMFSHALSTHRADNDIDFFTAVDDRQQDDPTVADEDRTGSGMMGTLEFTSATYYRYVGLNLDLLADSSHLQALSSEDFRKVVTAFLQACLMAVPSARRNSMNGSTLPGYVLGLARDNGHPLQLVNAFEEPVKSKGEGLLAPSAKKLRTHFEQMKTTWSLTADEVELPDKSLHDFCATLLSHV